MSTPTLIRKISPCFRKRQDLPTQLLETDDRQLPLERVADHVASRTVGLLANLVEQPPEVRLHADCDS